MAKNVHITRVSTGKWQAKTEKASRPIAVTSTQKAAIAIGRQVTRERGSELIIHRVNGQIRSKDSHGHDPFPPKG